MSFASINIKSKINRPRFRLCKPDREIIAPLNEIFNINLETNRGQISSLSFSFDSVTLRNNRFIENPLLNLLTGNLLIRMDYNNMTYYFIIAKQTKGFDSTNQTVNCQCYLQGYELNKVYRRGIEETSRTLRDLTTIILEGTGWTVSFIHEELQSLFRSYQADTVTALQGVFELAETFNAIPLFDSINKRISFTISENYGTNKGIRLKEGHYLESFNLDISDEEVVTRVYGYGNEGLEFRTLTATGLNYIEDYSWFMFPFEQDSFGNVIRSSRFMSDSLCVALVNYRNVLESVNDTFANENQTLLQYQRDLASEQQILSNMNTQLNIVNNTLDTINYTYEEQAVSRTDHIAAVNRKNELLGIIATIQNSISTLNTNIQDTQQRIQNLRISVSASQNFTNEQLNELSYYIREKEYSNDSIITASELLRETNLFFNDYKQPPISLSVGIDAFASYFDTTFINILSLGDIIRLRSSTLNVDVLANISGITYNFDDLTASLTIENARSYETGDNKFARELQAAINTSNSYAINSYRIREGANANTLVQRFINNEFEAARNNIVGGSNNTVVFNERGINNIDAEDSNTMMVLNNGKLYITPDGGNSVTVAISKNGIHANAIYGSLLVGNNLILETEEGILRADGSGVQIFNNNNDLKVQLGRYANPDNPEQFLYGLSIRDGAFSLRTTDETNRGATFNSEGLSAYNSNGARTFNLDFLTGVLSIVGSIDIKSTEGENRGVTIRSDGISSYNAAGIRTFFLDNSGQVTANNATVTGIINATDGTITGTLDVQGGFTGGTFDSPTIYDGNIQRPSLVNGTANGTSLEDVTINTSRNSILGRYVQIGQYTNLATESETLLSFGRSQIQANSSYIRSGYDDNNAFMNVVSGLNLTLQADNINSNGYFNVKPMALNTKARMAVSSENPNQGMVYELYRDNANLRAGLLGFDSASDELEINNTTSGRVSLKTTGSVAFLTINGMSIMNNAENTYLPINASAFIQNSQRKNKKNISENKVSALEMINNTKVYNYHYKNETRKDKKHLGLILEEAPNELIDSEEKGIDLYAMNSLLWKAVQELTEEIKELKKLT